jgi:Uma2 family endonuclease
MTIQEKVATVDDLWALSHTGQHCELVRGVIVEMTPAGNLHGIIALEIGFLLRTYVKAHDLGYVTAAETGFVLSAEPATVRAPDVGFIAKARMPQPIPEKYFPGAPDLAVEVISPGDSATDTRDTVLDYLRAGTRLVWIIYPTLRSADVYRSTETAQLVNSDGTLDGGDVLPGFTLPLRDVFQSVEL